MEPAIHQMPDLFRQLGLPEDRASVESFLAAHRPLPGGTGLTEAGFWNESQAQFLREEIAKDADWSGVVDQLGQLLGS
ncbi:MAG: DUF2789 domain-containing protein [Burkholderiaceae bacterium]|jgi:hypothetical protein|nr:DUF2789 domain-containing protein [Aquabacterium sp.]NUP85106.1 DUF2789 domain-containing protein [Burkholderiaceae bacterium]